MTLYMALAYVRISDICLSVLTRCVAIMIIELVLIKILWQKARIFAAEALL